MGKGGGGRIQMGSDLSDGQRVFTGADKQAKDREAGIMAKGGEGAGSCLMFCHSTKQNYKTSFVKMIRIYRRDKEIAPKGGNPWAQRF